MRGLLPPAPPLHVSAVVPAGGLLFFCVRRKEAKEDRILHKPYHKKGLPHTGSPFLKQKILSHIRFSGGCGRGLFPGKSLLPPAPLLHVPAVVPAGGLLFFCVRRKEAKEDRICTQVSVQKETTANRQSLFRTKQSSLYTLFGRVREGAFPGEKPSPASAATARPRSRPCRGPSFLLCQKKRSKRRPHITQTISQKRTTAYRQSHLHTKHPFPYTLFGRVREKAFPGEKPSPACTS